MNYTRHNLKKVESLFDNIGYDIRYEKGSFQSGYCIVEQKNIVVINKFYDVEGRIRALLEIMDTLPVDESVFDAKQLLFYRKVRNLQSNPSGEETPLTPSKKEL